MRTLAREETTSKVRRGMGFGGDKHPRRGRRPGPRGPPLPRAVARPDRGCRASSAASTRSSRSRASWTTETGTPAFAELDELLERGPQPDVVIVATPPETHADLCVRCLEAGAHLIVEKPFTETVADADRVLAAAAAAGRRVAVNHQFVEAPIFRAVIEAARRGDYGRLAFWPGLAADGPRPVGRAHRVAGRDGPQDAPRGRRAPRLPPHRASSASCPIAVTAQHSAGYHEDPEADAVQLVTLEFPGRRLGQITIDRLCKGGTRYMELRGDCERGSLRASLGGRAVVQVGMKRAERTGLRVDFGAGGLAWVETGLRRKTLARSPRDMTANATERVLRETLDASDGVSSRRRAGWPRARSSRSSTPPTARRRAARASRSGQLPDACREVTDAAASICCG